MVSVLLVLTGVGAALAGHAASAVSGCCGAPEGGDSTLAPFGIGVGAAVIMSGALLLSGGMTRWFVLVPAAVLPVACLASAPSSSDLAGLAPLALVGWVLLAVFVSRGRAAGWLAADRHPGTEP